MNQPENTSIEWSIEEVLIFSVKGREPEPYMVEFFRTDNNLTAVCNCQAGKVGIQCKHRINLLLGDTENLISGHEYLSRLKQMFKGSDVESALCDFLEAKEQESDDLKIYKKALIKRFND